MEPKTIIIPMLYYAAFSNAFIFLILSLLHFYWLLGGKWGMDSIVPTNERTSDKLFKPSAFSTLVVAVGLLVFGLVEVGSTGIFSDWADLKYFRWGNLLIVFIFLVRAVGDFKYVGFFKKVRGTVFAKNDSRYYAPLCLFIAVTSLLVVFI
jgi:hypothetical protein